LAEWFRKRVGTLAGRTRRTAIVAMARKLLIAPWRYVETGVGPRGLDQAGWHGAKARVVPNNVSLVPLRAPELNSQENIW
jgi:hypothetical protein